MGWIVRLMKSSIGAKFIMGLTGAGLFLFIVGHIAGNLLLYFGPEAMNAYAHGLKHLPYGLLWVARGGLLVIFLVHLLMAYRLSIMNSSARPQKYQFEATLKASFASRTMLLSGTFILLFLLYHLGHFTFHVVNFTGDNVDSLGRYDVYGMVIRGFQQPFIAITYVLAMLVLGLHLSHGLSSMFQSVGLNHQKYNPFFRNVMPLVGWVICAAGISLPLSVWLGIIKA